jgi:hypothetical protein
MYGMGITNEEKRVRFEVFTAFTMKNSSLWDVKSCGSYKSTTSATRRNIPDVGILKEEHVYAPGFTANLSN